MGQINDYEVKRENGGKKLLLMETLSIISSPKSFS